MRHQELSTQDSFIVAADAAAAAADVDGVGIIDASALAPATCAFFVFFLGGGGVVVVMV